MATGILALLSLTSVAVLFRAQRSGYQSVIYAAKPLAMTSIGLIAILEWPAVSPEYQIAIVAGLCLSLIGDIFLMLPKDRFLAGLTAFLLAHVAYIYAFLGRTDEIPILPFLPFVLAGLFLTKLLWPHLGKERLPVLVYSLVLAGMAGSALGAAEANTNASTIMAATGAVLFVISDAALAIGRFIRHAEGSVYLIWGTYFAAQLLIALSVAR